MNLSGATTEVETLRKVLSKAEDNAAVERTEREKQEAWVAEVRQELHALVKKHESLELESKAQASELATALETAKSAKAEAQKALQEFEEMRKIYKCSWRAPNSGKKSKVAFTCFLCIMNALPAAIFFTASISWRALWASALALRTLSSTCASSDSRVFESSSKDSCFLARASSSCCTSPTRASCFSHSMRSLAALSSALANAFLRVTTSVVAPDKSMMILLLYSRTSF